ncbi:flippase [Butyrivibrio sp. JL13D10]|uniref:flippase n=1 Tax=Butyrivibrio sp. JL13D10 TaxID=3236815 RepID=UPI0038B502A2
MEKRIRNNYFYNLIYEIFMLLVPFMITPYIARTLEENASGAYSFANSVVTYFVLLASLGFPKLAQRIVAYNQDNSEQQKQAFWNIFFAKLISTGFALVCYGLLCFFYGHSIGNAKLLCVLSINIVAVLFDITYLFQGNEHFKVIVIRNIIVKSIGFGCIFLFVKNEYDLLKYALIQSLTIFFSSVSLWARIPSAFFSVKLKDLSPLKYFPSAITLFIPTIATTIYTVFDKTLIGIITKSEIENGNYEYSERIIRMALTVITALGAVMIPRNSYYFANEEEEKLTNSILYSFRYAMFIGVPLAVGMGSVADLFVPLYLGNGYSKAVLLTKILSPLILIIGISNVLGVQWLIPTKQDKKFTFTIFTGATINLILNTFLIELYGCYGAGIASVIGELVITSMMLFYARDIIRIKELLTMGWKYFVASIAIHFLCLWLMNMVRNPFIALVTCVILCAGVYFCLLLLLKDEFFIQFVSSFSSNKKRE